MKYKEILNSRESQRKKIDNLKMERDLNNENFGLNEVIKKEKFKYMIYNAMLKGGNEDGKCICQIK